VSRAVRLRRGIAFLAVALSCLGGTATAQEKPAASDVAQANNPLANFTAFNLHNYYIGELTDPDKNANQFWMRYAKPFSIGKSNWLMRASLPVNTTPVAPTLDHETGLGDLNVFAAYLIDTGNPSLSFGIGPQITAPTASKDALGSEKWSAGLVNTLFNFGSPKFQYGYLLSWQASFAGSHDRDSPGRRNREGASWGTVLCRRPIHTIARQRELSRPSPDGPRRETPRGCERRGSPPFAGRAATSRRPLSPSHKGLVRSVFPREYSRLVQTCLLLREKERRPCPGRRMHAVAAFAVGTVCLIGAGATLAAETVSSQAPLKHFPVAQIFTFLFLMLGPFKIIGPFWSITKGADAALTRQIALRAIIFSSLALLVAAFLGQSFLSSYSIPVPVLALAAGIILFLVALLNILQQFIPPAAHGEDSAAPIPTLNVALTPLAFPTIVTPYGIAAVVVFLALSPTLQGQLIIGAIVLVIMLLNLIVMIMTRHILPVLGLILPILGAVLGVVQVALGLNIINTTLRMLGPP
jgi:small neutral amino acid transporter SnatA (MarC family)